MKILTLFAVVSLFVITNTYAANSDSLFFRQAEDSLVVLANSIVEPDGDQQRLENNDRFKGYFEEILDQAGAFEHPFDSLNTVSMLYAPDRQFRIITWYVPLSGEQFEYVGYIQRNPEAAGQGHAFMALTDATEEIDGQSCADGHADKWYGAFYYDLIANPIGDEVFYTLLGWKGDNPQTRKRVIEPLAFSNDKPRFGKPVFGEPYTDACRIIFRYSARASMSLLYEEDFHQTADGTYDMIVFDRLVPRHESLEDHYQFYVPEVNIFDGLFFNGKKWVLVKDVDARMPDPERDDQK